MNKELYDLCDWADIERLVYSEHDNPHSLLGAHVTEIGIVVNVFIPTAKSIVVKLEKTGKEYPMELADEAGFYSVLIPGKRIPSYTLVVVYDNDSEEEISDPYSFEPVIDAMDMKKFASGIHYSVYEKLGAHVMEIDGVKGTCFAVWAPNALRVSVVGDFNLWDGRRHQMRRLHDSGIFELFIPNISEGQIYKYELRINSTLVVLKADPYAFASELRPATASKVVDIGKYNWNDAKWMEQRKKLNTEKAPVSVYEVHLGSWKKPQGEDRDFYNYRELAVMLADYVTEMGYTHIELMPIMEHPYDASWGYQVTGYYAATSRYGTPDDFMYFVDYMHQKGIGVILDWVPAHFPKDAFGLANFDGTCLYEHLDPRQGYHPHWGTLIYNYGRPQVANFLIANALFWVEKYHADAIRMDAVASMLYLDYGKNDGEWIANIYGGKENLEAIEMLKNLNQEFDKRKDGSMIIAEESTSWSKVTGEIKDGGLGFDYKWNMGWMNDFTNYMKCDPLFRKGHHGELTFSMIYAYSEKFVLVLSHDEVVHGKASMINKMPGELEQKFANLRAAYGFMTAHPGKKLLFMGQEFAQTTEWNENKGLDWELLEDEKHVQMKEYVKALNRLYKDYPALYALDYESEGFEWINNMDSDRSIVSFLRKTEREEETLLVVCNFTPVVYEDYMIGVPFKGKYKETFNSDKSIFGGSDHVNPRMKQSKEEEMDGRANSISITVPPMGITVFTCAPSGETKAAKKTIKTAAKKPAKKTVVKPEVKSETKSEEVETSVKPKTAVKPVAPMEAPKKVTTKKTELKKVETKKTEPKKVETKKTEPKKVSTKKTEPAKVETKKVEPKKVETKKVEPAKVETKKVELKKVETKKVEAKKVETKKAEPKKVETKKIEPKKVETKKVEPKKVEPKKVATKKIDSEEVITEIMEPKESDSAKEIAVNKVEAEKVSAKEVTVHTAETERVIVKEEPAKKEQSEKTVGTDAAIDSDDNEANQKSKKKSGQGKNKK